MKHAVNSVMQRFRQMLAVGDASEQSDVALLERFAAKADSAAFEVIVRRHGPMVLGVCRRLLRDPADADDAFQATFAILMRKASTLSRPELLAGWLFQVAFRTARKARSIRLRRRSRQMPLLDIPVEASIAEVMWRELQPIFDEEVNRLPEKLRLPVVMCFLEGRTKRSAARMLGWPEGTFACRLQQARELLRIRLERRGIALSASGLSLALIQGTASAAVPAVLVSSTVQSAALIAAGAVLSSPAALLTQGVIQSMFLSKLKIVAALVLTAGVIGSGSGWVLNSGTPGSDFAFAAQPGFTLAENNGGEGTLQAIDPNATSEATDGLLLLQKELELTAATKAELQLQLQDNERVLAEWKKKGDKSLDEKIKAKTEDQLRILRLREQIEAQIAELKAKAEQLKAKRLAERKKLLDEKRLLEELDKEARRIDELSKSAEAKKLLDEKRLLEAQEKEAQSQRKENDRLKQLLEKLKAENEALRLKEQESRKQAEEHRQRIEVQIKRNLEQEKRAREEEAAAREAAAFHAANAKIEREVELNRNAELKLAKQELERAQQQLQIAEAKLKEPGKKAPQPSRAKEVDLLEELRRKNEVETQNSLQQGQRPPELERQWRRMVAQQENKLQEMVQNGKADHKAAAENFKLQEDLLARLKSSGDSVPEITILNAQAELKLAKLEMERASLFLQTAEAKLAEFRKTAPRSEPTVDRPVKKSPMDGKPGPTGSLNSGANPKMKEHLIDLETKYQQLLKLKAAGAVAESVVGQSRIELAEARIKMELRIVVDERQQEVNRAKQLFDQGLMSPGEYKKRVDALDAARRRLAE